MHLDLKYFMIKKLKLLKRSPICSNQSVNPLIDNSLCCVTIRSHEQRRGKVIVKPSYHIP